MYFDKKKMVNIYIDYAYPIQFFIPENRF